MKTIPFDRNTVESGSELLIENLRKVKFLMITPGGRVLVEHPAGMVCAYDESRLAVVPPPPKKRWANIIYIRGEVKVTSVYSTPEAALNGRDSGYLYVADPVEVEVPE